MELEEPKMRLRGWRKRQLIRDLALGELSTAQLAEKYEQQENSINGFLRRNKEFIDEVKAAHDNEYAGLWIASKSARIAEYQQDVEEINEVLARQLDSGEDLNAGLIRMKHVALKSVAEELGALPNRVTLQSDNKVVTYHIEGVDPESVK
jgi:hypothetical protein